MKRLFGFGAILLSTLIVTGCKGDVQSIEQPQPTEKQIVYPAGSEVEENWEYEIIWYPTGVEEDTEVNIPPVIYTDSIES